MSIPSHRGRGSMLLRRRFVTGTAATAAFAGLGISPFRAHAAQPLGNDRVLSGTQFDLTVDETPLNITGRASTATTVNGSVPARILRWKEGDTVTLRVTNRMAASTSIHWHGILLPFQMDGVPGLSFAGIQPGETFTYRFDVKQSGTYWYHSHSRFQEQTGLYGAIVIEPRGGERHRTDRDYVVMLSDWSDDSPELVMANLKKMSDFYNFNEPTAVEFVRDASRMGLKRALAERKMWNQMRMSPTDFSDVTGHHYTYLINGASPDANWAGLFKRGEKVRLRVINGSSQSIFDLRIPGLKMTVVAADGQDVEPVTVDEFPDFDSRNLRCRRPADRRSRLHDLRPVDRPRRLRASHARAAIGHASRCTGARSAAVVDDGRHDGLDGHGRRHGGNGSRRHGGNDRHGSHRRGARRDADGGRR